MFPVQTFRVHLQQWRVQPAEILQILQILVLQIANTKALLWGNSWYWLKVMGNAMEPHYKETQNPSYTCGAMVTNEAEE